jgi:hypothetical protein
MDSDGDSIGDLNGIIYHRHGFFPFKFLKLLQLHIGAKSYVYLLLILDSQKKLSIYSFTF